MDLLSCYKKKRKAGSYLLDHLIIYILYIRPIGICHDNEKGVADRQTDGRTDWTIHNLPDYSYVFDLPTRNNYGGVALLIRQELNQFKDDLILKWTNLVIVMIVDMKMYGED